MGQLGTSQGATPNSGLPFPVSPFGSLVLSLINNNNMHAPKLPPNESHKTLPGLYLQHAIDNRP